MASEFVPAESVTIRDSVEVIARRWRVIALFVVLGLVAALGYSHAKSTHYVSNAQVQVLPVTSNPFSSSPAPIASVVSMPTEQKIATSLQSADAVAAALGHGITGQQALANLTVTVPASTEILNFAY